MLELTKKQKQAFDLLTDHETNYIGYGGSAGSGKSVLGCYNFMQLSFYANGAKSFIGRDSLKDTRASVLFTFSWVANLFGFTDYKFTDYGIEFGNSSVIELLDLSYYPYKDPQFDRLGSKEYTAGWIEEAQQTHHLAFEVLKTRVGRWRNEELNITPKIFCTFNPSKNWVDETFYRPFANGNENNNTRFIYALPTDNKHLPAEYIERLKNLKDEATKQRLLFGNFDYDSDPTTLISYKYIEAIWTNNFNNTGERYIISDVARFGSDLAVITYWDGMTLKELFTFEISKITDIRNCIESIRARNSVTYKNIIVDDDGVGGGLTDLLGCTGFVNNSKSFDRQFYNLKSECGYKLSEKIKDISVVAEIDLETKKRIEQELAQLKTFDADKDNKLRILPKEKIKSNIGRSPDFLDVFIMRMLPEVDTVNNNLSGISMSV